MDSRKVAIDSARALHLLDDNSALVPVDSLGMIDLVAELERRGKVRIPSAFLTDSAFKSIDAIVAMLEHVQSESSRK